MESLYLALIVSAILTILVDILFDCVASLHHGEDEL